MSSSSPGRGDDAPTDDGDVQVSSDDAEVLLVRDTLPAPRLAALVYGAAAEGPPSGDTSSSASSRLGRREPKLRRRGGAPRAVGPPGDGGEDPPRRAEGEQKPDLLDRRPEAAEKRAGRPLLLLGLHGSVPG